MRAMKHWAVVRKSVLPEKDEFLEKANKGKTEEWLEQWNKRRKTQTKLKQLMRHLRLAVRDFNVKDMFIRFTEGNKFPPTYPRDRKVPLWRPANKTSLTAILHMLDLNLTRERSGPCTKLFYAAWSDDKLPRLCLSYQSIYTDAFSPQKEEKR